MNQQQGNASRDLDVGTIRDALASWKKTHRRADIHVYRHNSVSIRIRIVDPSFHGKDRVDRDDEVWKILEKLPEDVQSQITLLLLLTPEEKRLSFANFEFENPIPSRL